MKRVMLYFGSFNPVHGGHMAVAEYVLEHKLCDELWFVVSPRNPLKEQSVIADEKDRLNMVSIAVAGSGFCDRMKTCDIEFGLPKPSYTIDTLDILNERNPNVSFSLLFGSDITGQTDRWKEWQRIVSEYKIFIYPRTGYDIPTGETYTVLDGAPRFDCSSTEIRETVARGGDAAGLIPPGVYEYIKEHKLWQNTTG